ncbi:MAG: hypothetical protein IT323_12625 [Anaerolineae bacterium]|nr:hypothetical protein [Anaerolineae bacterium]
MASSADTLGRFIADLMEVRGYNNSTLATAASTSESVIRNLLKHGIDKRARDPDPSTLRRVADALEVNALYLFRLAGYIPPKANVNSARAEFLADAFDELSPEKQDAVMGVLEALSEGILRKVSIHGMREAPGNPLAGLDLAFPEALREMANELIAQLQITKPVQLESVQKNIRLGLYRWGDLPQATRERIKALARHKLALKYDPTMVDEEWRG